MRQLVATVLALGLLTAEATAAEPRLVTLGGSITEIVHALGAGDRIVAVDTTSRHPPAADALPKVGYLRTLSAEGILSLNPDMVLGLDEAGPPQALAQLRDSGTRLLLVPEPYSPDGVTMKIRAVAGTLGLTARGDALAASVASDLARIGTAIAAVPRRPKVLFLLAVSRGAPLASGTGTAADAMIRLAGGENAIAGYRGYKPLSLEMAVAAAPEILLMMQQSVELLGGADAVLKLPAIAASDLGRTRRLVALDGAYLLGFGPRTAHALHDLARHFHPEVDLPALPARAWVDR
jgi:iron complex transport system substrate-binding protein